MKEITLTQEQYDRLPYRTTMKSKDATFGEIIGLLRGHGVRKYFMDEDTETLSFGYKVQQKDMTREFLVKLTVPHLMVYKKVNPRSRSSGQTLVYLEKESWRTLWWYLKSKLEAIEFGISDDLKEFIPNIYYQLDKNGPEINLADTIIENADQIVRMKAITDESQKARVVQDAEYTVEEEKRERKIIEAEVSEK